MQVIAVQLMRPTSLMKGVGSMMQGKLPRMSYAEWRRNIPHSTAFGGSSRPSGEQQGTAARAQHPWPKKTVHHAG